MLQARLLAAALAALAVTPALADTSGWVSAVQHAIAARQTYPVSAEMHGEEGVARVRIYIAADGAVMRSELITRSGSPTLDREALAVGARVGHVPAPPAGATVVLVPMVWKLT